MDCTQYIFFIALVVYVYSVYFIYRWARLPQWFMRKRYLSIIVLLLILVGVTVLFTHFPFYQDQDITDVRQIEARRNMRTQTIWFFFLVVTGFSLSINLTFELFQQILSKQEIAAEKNKAELALYKAQINPHFLFNTLNTLYALVLSGSDKTESAFVKFSNILRYMYAQTNSETIPIGQEIEYIRQYVDLQSLRLNRHTRVEMDVETDNDHSSVPPMVLITFVENAFKYGTSSDTDCVIRILIRVHEGRLFFETENAVMRKPEQGRPAIGIANCRKRLELLYPGRFRLETGEKNGMYNVRLEILIRE